MNSNLLQNKKYCKGSLVAYARICVYVYTHTSLVLILVKVKSMGSLDEEFRPYLLAGREVGREKEFDFFSIFHCLVGPILMKLNFH